MRERWWTLGALAFWPLFCAGALGLPLVQAEAGDPGLWRVLALQAASGVFGISLLAAILLTGERPLWPVWVRWASFITGVGATALLFGMQITGPWPMALHALALVAIALPIGYWIGSHMERVTHLVPLAIAMSMADIYSVTGGPSRHIAEQINQRQNDVAERAGEIARTVTPDAVHSAGAQAQAGIRAGLGDFLVANLPLAGQRVTAPLLGIGDLIALAFIFRVAWVHRLSPGKVFAAALGSTLAALTLAQVKAIPIPALPVICLGVLGVLFATEPRLRRLDKQELALSIGVVALFLALIAVRWVRPA